MSKPLAKHPLRGAVVSRVGQLADVSGIDDNLRRLAVLAVPVVVPLHMSATFALLRRRFSAQTAYNVGFGVYWLAWCLCFPTLILGPRSALRLLTQGRRPSVLEAVVLLLPVAGAAGSELWPNRRMLDARVVTVSAVSALLNAPSEELLWRGVFLQQFPQDALRGAIWPLVGFSLWHLAPQIVLPSRHGRWPFVLGAGFVGSASALSVWRSRGLRNCLLPHIITDACGVTAARFRLGR